MRPLGIHPRVRSVPGIREAAVGVVHATIELLVEFVSRGCRCGIATAPESRDEVLRAPTVFSPLSLTSCGEMM